MSSAAPTPAPRKGQRQKGDVLRPQRKRAAMPGAGRPKGTTILQPNEDTLRELAGLARIQCTTKEAAAVLQVAEQTFLDFLERNKEARNTWNNGREHGKASLRRMQIKAAEGGNVTAQIWLGKQYLGQSDKTDTTLRGDAENPVVTEVRFTIVDPGHSGTP